MKYFFIITLLSITLNAQTALYVSKAGSSIPPYSSWETAANTLSLAYETANNDDTIFVANGRYKENLVIGKRLSFIGESSVQTIIDGTNLNDISIRIDSNVTLKDLSIIGKSLSTSVGSVAIFFICDSVFFSNLQIDSSSTLVAGIGEVVLNECILRNSIRDIDVANPSKIHNVTITNSVFCDNHNTDAVVSRTNGNIEISNCVFTSQKRNNLITAFTTGFPQKSFTFKNNLVYSAEFAGVILFEVEDSILIKNNTFVNQYSNTSTGNGAVVADKNDNPVVINNIFYNCDKAINLVRFDNVPYSVDYNGYYKNKFNVFYGYAGENAVFADPMFNTEPQNYAPDEFDLRLQMYSPMIDAGHPDIKDKDGTRSDIGAFGGPGGESYSYQDLPPLPPAEVTVDYDSGTGAVLNWTENSAADFEGYKLYRSNTQNITATPDYLYSTIDTNSYTDTDIESDKNYYYIITGIDKQGNEGEASTKVEVILTNLGEVEVTPVYDYKLIQNYPNPFNPSTKIVFHLKESGYVRLAVYTLTGELIEELVSEHQQSGYHELTFDGSHLSSGMYLYKIEAKDSRGNPVFSSMKKMVLVK